MPYQDHTVTIFVDSSSNTLKRAGRLIEIAETFPGDTATLAAAAVVITAAAIEQAVTGQLDLLLAQEDGDTEDASTVRNLLGQSSWQKIRQLPELLTGGELTLTWGPLRQTIRALISARNTLVHMDGLVQVFDDVGIDVGPPDDSGARPAVWDPSDTARVCREVKRHPEPWAECSLAQARQYEAAVRRYLDALACLDRVPGDVFVSAKH